MENYSSESEEELFDVDKVIAFAHFAGQRDHPEAPEEAQRQEQGGKLRGIVIFTNTKITSIIFVRFSSVDDRTEP